MSSAPMLEQAPPAAPDAERAVLGAIMLNNELVFAEENTLRVDEFFLDSHRRIYGAMLTLANDSKAIDLITLTDELEKTKELVKVGGVAYVSGLTDGVARRSSVKHYVEIVHEKAKLRRLIATCSLAISDALEDEKSDVVAGKLVDDVVAVTAENASKSIIQIGEDVHEVWQRIEVLRNEKRDVVGLRSPIHELDECTTGFRAGEYTIIAGWPGTGKSALASQVALTNGQDLEPVGWFSAEMQREEVQLRLVSQITGIDYLRLRNPAWIHESKMTEVGEALHDLKKLPIHIDDSPSLEISQLIARSRQMVARGAKIIIYDYIQKFRVRGEKDPRLTVNIVSESLRDFAKSTKTPIVVLSQLTRPKEGAVRRPRLFDLKESGNLEADAHVVLLLYRPVDNRNEYTGDDEVIIAKQRSGPTGTVDVRFDGAALRYKWRNRDEQKSEEPAKQTTKKSKSKDKATGEKDDDANTSIFG